MTPAELSAYFDGISDSERDAYRRVIYGAYLCAKLSRVREFPSFEEVLYPLESVSEVKEQTPEEMLSIIQSFDAGLKRR